MIKRLRIQNYKALRDVTLELTPIHVLIGPNDSGKTSILEAVAALCRSVDLPFDQAFAGTWEGNELVWNREPGVSVVFDTHVETDTAPLQYHLGCRFAASGRRAVLAAERVTISGAPDVQLQTAAWNHSRIWAVLYGNLDASDAERAAVQRVHDALAGVQYLRCIPRMLALPVAPDAARGFRLDPSGFGLSHCLDEILGYDRDRFAAMESQFRQIFPDIKSIKLKTEPAYRSPPDHTRGVPQLQPADGKGIHFEFASTGKEVRASQVSDGVLLVLAYLAVLYMPRPPRVILVEEPENGIHYRRLNDVLKILRELVSEHKGSQVILTTHSPYVLDLFEPQEVSLCRKEKAGDISVHRLSDSEKVRDQLDIFGLGEIWTAEGDEALAPASKNGGGK